MISASAQVPSSTAGTTGAGGESVVTGPSDDSPAPGPPGAPGEGAPVCGVSTEPVGSGVAPEDDVAPGEGCVSPAFFAFRSDPVHE